MPFVETRHDQHAETGAEDRPREQSAERDDDRRIGCHDLWLRQPEPPVVETDTIRNVELHV